jgi:zinc finger SWIM domain-containing protein 3
VILTDKDMSERNVSGKAIPQANLQLCMFHVPRNCRREVSVEKLGISVGEKIRALEILQDIVHSKSDEQYKLHYNKLCNDCSNAVISYYNWHNIRKEWVDGLKDGVNLGNRTNNRIESINDKVKSVFKHHSTLPEFAENFLIALKSLRTERDLKTVGMFQKKAVAPYPKESPEYKYRELVTPYAWSFILKQLMQMSEVTIEEHAHPSKRNLQLKLNVLY